MKNCRWPLGFFCMMFILSSVPAFTQEASEDTTYELEAPAEATPTPTSEEVPINWGGEDSESEDYGDF